MASEQPPEVTLLLRRLAEGDRSAEAELIPHVYAELRRLAGAYMRRERTSHTLQPTALVHEAYLRLVGQREVNYKNRAHFFGIAAQVMRNILVDHARRHRSAKRGSGQSAEVMPDLLAVADRKIDLILDVDRLLDKLKQTDQRQARIVELRYFGGLTEEEIALLMSISSRTVKRDWMVAKAWMAAAIAAEAPS